MPPPNTIQFGFLIFLFFFNCKSSAIIFLLPSCKKNSRTNGGSEKKKKVSQKVEWFKNSSFSSFDWFFFWKIFLYVPFRFKGKLVTEQYSKNIYLVACKQSLWKKLVSFQINNKSVGVVIRRKKSLLVQSDGLYCYSWNAITIWKTKAIKDSSNQSIKPWKLSVHW